MLLAIDVGNTHTVFGIWDGKSWAGAWRRVTSIDVTEDQLAGWFQSLRTLSGVTAPLTAAICCSVVPSADQALSAMCSKWFDLQLRFLRSGCQVGITVEYDPPHAVGADRIANALAALARFKPPIIVVDCGTATTFDSIGPKGTYLGGAIMPGVKLSSQALVLRAAKLPQFQFEAPDQALGRNTVESLQSGMMFGYAGAIDALARRIDKEMGGGSTIISTGGQGGLFVELCDSVQSYEPTLTLDGLVLANDRF
jgi:type III pantothenate kinase